MKNDDIFRVLLVDDAEENRNAALEYFRTREDVVIDFARNYLEAVYMMEKNFYDFALIDLEIPFREGENPGSRKLGLDLAKEAESYRLEWAIVTSGVFVHNRQNKSFVLYGWFRIPDLNEIQHIDKKRLDPLSYDFNFQVYNELKNEPSLWKKVYETLYNKVISCYLGLREAKLMYRKEVGRNYKD